MTHKTFTVSEFKELLENKTWKHYHNNRFNKTTQSTREKKFTDNSLSFVYKLRIEAESIVMSECDDITITCKKYFYTTNCATRMISESSNYSLSIIMNDYSVRVIDNENKVLQNYEIAQIINNYEKFVDFKIIDRKEIHSECADHNSVYFSSFLIDRIRESQFAIEKKQIKELLETYAEHYKIAAISKNKHTLSLIIKLSRDEELDVYALVEIFNFDRRTCYVFTSYDSKMKCLIDLKKETIWTTFTDNEQSDRRHIENVMRVVKEN